MKTISKNELCEMYGLTYKTLALKLKPIAKEIQYSSKKIFSPKEMQIIEKTLGNPNIKHITKKELKNLLGISYKMLATWVKPIFGEQNYKKKRYFSPAEFELIAEKIGVPGEIFTDEHDNDFIRNYSLVKGRIYDPPVRW
ncbi:MAG: hypothetical protein ACXVDT_11835 [Bacteroidia bacterium]